MDVYINFLLIELFLRIIVGTNEITITNGY